MKKNLKIWHISYSDKGGGAAKAAYRTFLSIQNMFPNSKFIVNDKQTDDKKVITLKDLGINKRQFFANRFSSRVNKLIGNNLDNP